MRGRYMNMRKLLALAAAASMATTACLDLDVANLEDADAERALATPGDLEALIGGGWRNWWNSSSANSAPGPILFTASYQHSATAANFGMVEFSSWPKVPAHYLPSHSFYSQNVANAWIWNYRAISAVTDGLKVLDAGTVELETPEDLARNQALGYYTLGLAHGTIAMLYDQGYIFDPSIALEDVALQPYGDVMTAALGYFDRAIQEAQGQSFTIPSAFMSQDVSAAQLVRMAYSMKARYRANVARTPAERAAVNWQSVAADAANGVTEDWSVNVRSGSGYSSGTLVNIHRFGPWGELSYQVLGMADVSGQYQKWLARPDPWDRHPNLADNQVDDPFLIMTPDLRFAQGATIAEQEQNDGVLYELPTASGGFAAGWARPDRGSFRWSYYRYVANDQWHSSANRTEHPEITLDEMRLLQAEAAYRANDLATAANLINVTRTAAGLNATDASGTNTSCVPKMANGSCGDLWEMYKWEMRLETMYQGLLMAPWYFHGRGWGDLPSGVMLHMPVPGREAELLGIPPYTFGGSGEGAAPIGTYGY